MHLVTAVYQREQFASDVDIISMITFKYDAEKDVLNVSQTPGKH